MTHIKRNLLRAYRTMMPKRTFWRLRGYLKSIGAWS